MPRTIETPHEKLIREELWFRGDLTYLLRPHGQTWCHDHFEKHRRQASGQGELLEIGWNCHRRLGKTFLLLLLCIQWALRRPRQQVKFFAPTKLQAKDIVGPVLSFILEQCPRDLYPIRREGRRTWAFFNPRWEEDERVTSEMKLFAVNKGQADSSRGTACDFAALDECGQYEDMGYLIDSVLLPQFVGREDPAMVMATSAPVSPAHEFFEVYEPKLQEHGAFLTINGDKNPDFTEADRRIILKSCPGGEGSVAWRREFGCEKIADQSQMILPEFADLSDELVVKRWKRPAFFEPWCCLDTGWVDHTAVLYGYVDFEKQLLVIEHVIWCHYKSTGEIHRLMIAAEAELYPERLLRRMGGKRIKRVGDLTPQQLDDFRKDMDPKMYFRPVDKYDRDGAVARLRTAIQMRKIRIVQNPSTEPLIYQCRHGIWNEARTDFARLTVAGRAESSMMGHCDCIACLVYMYRSIPFTHNPFPTPRGLPSGPDVFRIDCDDLNDRQGVLKAFGNSA